MRDVSHEQILGTVKYHPQNTIRNRPPRNLSHNKDSVQDLIQSMLYEEEYQTLTSLTHSIEIHKY